MATARNLYPDRRGKKNKGLHIEAKGCIVNIREDLEDRFGRQVTHIEIIPDNYIGEPKRKVVGSKNIRVIALKQKNR